MRKKGFEFTFNIMIGLALMLIIVAILLFIVTGKVSLVGKSNTCLSRGGFCTTQCDYATVFLNGCDAKEVCCLKPA